MLNIEQETSQQTKDKDNQNDDPGDYVTEDKLSYKRTNFRDIEE